MKHWWLAIIPCLSLAGVADIQKEQALAEDIVALVYQSAEVEKHCRAEPNSTYKVIYEGMPILVDCEVRNKWVDLQKKHHIYIQ